MGKHKKTKKEKIISGLKRKLTISVSQAPKASSRFLPSPSFLSKDVSPLVLAKKLRDKEKNNNLSLIEPSFVFNGLKKVAFFTILAIGFEIMLYWWLELGGEKILAKIKL